MQSKQFARVAADRLGCKTGHSATTSAARSASRPQQCPGSTRVRLTARPRPALLVANEDPASDEAVPVVNRDGMRRGVDLDAAERAAADFLAALGIDLDREERRAAPARMARAYAELLAARPFRLTTFPTT